MATMIVKERAQKMISEAVEKELITPFEEKVVNHAEKVQSNF